MLSKRELVRVYVRNVLGWKLLEDCTPFSRFANKVACVEETDETKREEITERDTSLGGV
jgi:hypothetical protein